MTREQVIEGLRKAFDDYEPGEYELCVLGANGIVCSIMPNVWFDDSFTPMLVVLDKPTPSNLYLKDSDALRQVKLWDFDTIDDVEGKLKECCQWLIDTTEQMNIKHELRKLSKMYKITIERAEND